MNKFCDGKEVYFDKSTYSDNDYPNNNHCASDSAKCTENENDFVTKNVYAHDNISTYFPRREEVSYINCNDSLKTHSECSQSSDTDDEGLENDFETLFGSVDDDFLQIMNNFAASDIHANTVPSMSVYKGSNLSVLHGIAAHFYAYIIHPGVSKETFSDFLRASSSIISPLKSNMPSDYKTARNYVSQNDCIIYRRKYKDLESCSICGSQLYLPSTKAVSSNRRVACRKCIYLPIGQRLKRMFGNISLCELMISHAKLTCDGVTVMRDISMIRLFGDTNIRLMAFFKVIREVFHWHSS